MGRSFDRSVARTRATAERNTLILRDGQSIMRRMAEIQRVQRKRGRPPKSDGDHRETRETLCRAGVAALTSKGFSATGIEEILRAAGVPKGSFYHFFASKEAFGAELIDRYADYFAAKLDRFFLNNELSPLARLEAFCNNAEQGMRRFSFRRGCLVGNLGQEMEALPESYRAKLTAVFADWQSRLAKCLEEAKAAGEIASSTDCRRWSEFFWIGWEGAVLRAKLERKGEPLRIFAALFQVGLRA
jgi:TetR/AcrR family transcriptional repressor of nem operon